MDLAPLSLVLAVTTAWATIFIGFLPARALELQSREVLTACGAWILAGLMAPLTIIHWYLIFAIICFVAWVKLVRGYALGGKTWLSVASGLGIGLGVVFLIQAAPGSFPAGVSPHFHLLWLVSIHLGGAVTGLAYAGYITIGKAESRPFAPGYASLLIVLATAWAVVTGIEMESHRPAVITFSHVLIEPEILLVPMGITVLLSACALFALRRQAGGQARRFFATASVLAFGTQLFAHGLVP
jgi:hypothetical protein